MVVDMQIWGAMQGQGSVRVGAVNVQVQDELRARVGVQWKGEGVCTLEALGRRIGGETGPSECARPSKMPRR